MCVPSILALKLLNIFSTGDFIFNQAACAVCANCALVKGKIFPFVFFFICIMVAPFFPFFGLILLYSGTLTWADFFPYDGLYGCL